MKKNRFGIGCLSLALLGGPAWSADNTQLGSRLAMPTTQEGGTARAMSMGSAVVAVPQGSASLFWNPAGLARCDDQCMELGLHHNSGLGGSNQETAVIGLPMGSLGGFAASLNFANNGSFEGRDSLGNTAGNYSAGNVGGALGWGKEWFPGVSAGVAAKYNRQNLAGRSYSATAADVGLMWNPLDRLDLGVTYANLGTKVAGRLLDSGWRVGAAYGLNKNVLLAGSSEVKTGGFDRIQLGIEAFVHPLVALRAGYVHNLKESKLDGLTGLTAGMGIRIVKNVMLDYAYLPLGELGASQRISLTFKFSCAETGKAAQVQASPKVVAEAKPTPVVEPRGAVLDNVVILEDAHFEFDSTTLTKEGKKGVLENTNILKENPKARIRIAGYASASGTEAYNQKLSESRASAVKELLIIEGGIARSRMVTIGYGETRPAMYEAVPSDLHTTAAHANKRVLFEVIVK